MRSDPHEDLAAAIEAERAAWRGVKDHLPGTPGHDPQLWDTWRAAMRRCEEARRRIHSDGPALRQDVPPHG
jgi:ferritin-like protein